MRSAKIIAFSLMVGSAMGCTITTSHPETPAPRRTVVVERSEQEGHAEHRDRDHERRDHERRRSTAATLGIPPGHLPPPGRCRIWVPGVPPGHQARARSCRNIDRYAPAGSLVLYRPGRDRKVVYVREVDPRRAGVIIHIRVFDAALGTLIRVES